MRSLRVVLAGVVLAAVLGLEALVLLGPGGSGIAAFGRSRAALVAPTLLRLISLQPQAPARTVPPAATPKPVAARAPVAGPTPPPAAPAAAPSAPVSAAKPAPAERKHVVHAGDTLWEISRQYGVAVDALASVNKGVDPGDLQVGQVLTIPPGNGPAPAAAEPAADSMAHVFSWPALAPISSLFGPRWGSFHTGIDLAVASGTPVHAAREGKVSQAGPMGGYGLCVIVDHSDGTKTLYAHNSRLLVATGDSVRQGDTIARSGNTGNSTGPHLHFEIIVGNRPRNPLDYLPNVGLAIQENR